MMHAHLNHIQIKRYIPHVLTQAYDTPGRRWVHVMFRLKNGHGSRIIT
jgi:hypothetical protein